MKNKSFVYFFYHYSIIKVKLWAVWHRNRPNLTQQVWVMTLMLALHSPTLVLYTYTHLYTLSLDLRNPSRVQPEVFLITFTHTYSCTCTPVTWLAIAPHTHRFYSQLTLVTRTKCSKTVQVFLQTVRDYVYSSPRSGKRWKIVTVLKKKRLSVCLYDTTTHYLHSVWALQLCIIIWYRKVTTYLYSSTRMHFTSLHFYDSYSHFLFCRLRNCIIKTDALLQIKSTNSM